MSNLLPNERRPGLYQQHRYLRGQGRTLPVKLALVGARSSTASDAFDGKLVRIRNRAESQKLFQGGSMLDLMVRMALASGQLARNDRPPGGTPELYCLPLPPVSGAGTVTATQLLQLDGTATNSASVGLHIQDLAVPVPVARGETAEIVAGRLVEYARRVESDCAYVATASGGTLTMTAKEPGAWGEQLFLDLDTSEVNGITAAVTRGDNGAGQLDLTAARERLLAVDWAGVCFPGSEPAMVPVIKGYVDDAWNYRTGHAPLVITGYSGDASAAMTAARGYNHRYIAMAWSEHVQKTGGVWDARHSARSHDFEVAAAVAGRLFSQPKVNANYNQASLPCFGRADSMDRDTLNETIAAGVTVVLQPAIGDELGRIEDPVVTMSTDENGAPDTEWQPVECVRVVAEITRQIGAELRGFPRMDGDDDTKASAKSGALAVLRAAAKQKLVQPPADDHVEVDYETVNGARRLIVEVSYGVIVGLDIVEVTHNISRA